MHPIYTKENINLNSLMDYVFHELSPTEENAMENFLDENEEYSDTVNGILNYCLKENIKTKKALENNLENNKAAFFLRFPEIDPKNLKPSTSINTENKSGNGKFIWLLFFLLFIVGGLFVFSKFLSSGDNSQNEQINNQSTQGSEQIDVSPNIKNKENEKQEDTTQDDHPQDSLNKKKPPRQQDSKNKITSPRAELTPQELKRIEKEIERQKPLMAQASETWNKEFEMLGSPPLENAINRLAEGDSTSYARYCVGLHELTKEKPDLNIAIQLLSGVQPYEHPDATWYLFRAYLLSGAIEKAKLEFEKMDKNNTVYYNENFLKELSPTTIDFFR